MARHSLCKATGFSNLVGFQPSDRALRPWGPSQGKEVDELLVGLSALTLNGCPFEKRKRAMGSRSLGGSIGFAFYNQYLT